MSLSREFLSSSKALHASAIKQYEAHKSTPIVTHRHEVSWVALAHCPHTVTPSLCIPTVAAGIEGCG